MTTKFIEVETTRVVVLLLDFISFFEIVNLGFIAALRFEIPIYYWLCIFICGDKVCWGWNSILFMYHRLKLQGMLLDLSLMMEFCFWSCYSSFLFWFSNSWTNFSYSRKKSCLLGSVSCLLGSLYYSKLCLLLWVTI